MRNVDDKGWASKGVGANASLARLAALALAAAMGAAACGGGGGSGPKVQSLTILHTNDIHSHLMGASPEVDYTPATTGDDHTTGGIARLAAEISQQRTAAGTTPVLLLDAGDFMMGSLFELLATTAATELTTMQAMGYDATTIGNHELDWGPGALAAILNTAVANGVTIPVVASNVNFSATDPGDDGLQALAAAGVIQTKLIKTVGALKVGIFGLLGAQASQLSVLKAPLTFTDIATAAQAMVTELRQTDQVDMVIALSHSGIYADGTGEDADLAAAVPGIDVIVSGHTHDSLSAPAQVGQTLIVTAGAYGDFLGKLQLSVTKGANTGDPATVALDNYDLIPIDDQIQGDAATQTAVDGYIAGVDQALTGTGLTYEAVVGETTVDLPLPLSAEAPVGDLVTDAYRNVTASLQPDDPPEIAIEGSGQLRSDIAKGDTGLIWFADLFRVVPDGIGPDQDPGFPLVTFFLNAKDIASGLEFDAAQDVIPRDFFLQVSGVTVSYDMTRPAFGRVTGLDLVTSSGAQPLDPTDTTTCYKIVTTNYVAGLLGVVQQQTGGLLQVAAKASDCATLIDPTMQLVDADPNTDGVQELKDWQALVEYVGGMPPGADGVPTIPASYGTTQGRIVAQ